MALVFINGAQLVERKWSNYHKILIISSGLIFVQKAFFAGLNFGEAYFWRGLLLEGILCFKMGWA